MEVNGISFGAVLNGNGKEILKNAKVLAKYKDYKKPNTEHYDTVINSLKLIDKYHPQSTLNITIEKINGRSYYKVKENDESIYNHLGGDDFEFIRDFANAIFNNKLLK